MLGDTLEQGRLHGAGGEPGEVELPVDLVELARVHQALHAGLDGSDVCVGLAVGVDLERPQRVGDGGLAVADGAAEEVGERMGGVGGDEQATPAAGGGGEAQGRRRGGLADAALAPDEDDGAVQDLVEQGGAPA